MCLTLFTSVVDISLQSEVKITIVSFFLINLPSLSFFMISSHSYTLKATDMANSRRSCPVPDPASLAFWMASSEVDQKALGNFAAATSFDTPFLSAMLYRVLGLSVMLSKKLLRARKLRRLDTTRETKSLQLYHHIIWLSREGLLILEEFVLPLVQGYVELKVLTHKLRASFYHIFVLFHNQPAIHSPGIISLPNGTALPNGVCQEPSHSKEPYSRFSFNPTPEVLPTPSERKPLPNGVPLGSTKQYPPGLGPVQPPKSASSYLLPSMDYMPSATACFNHAAALAEKLLPGSHPLRLSVNLEYAAYLYDCHHNPTACRRLAKKAIADVYNAQEAMDDESFEDAAEIVGILGKMIKRGGKTSSAGTSSGTLDKSRSDNSRSPPKTTAKTESWVKPPKPVTSHGLPPAVPHPSMMNPI